MVETGASGIRKIDLGAVDQDIIPDLDDTRDLGSAAKRWAALYVILALVTSLTIGGVVKLTTTNFGLIINDSTNIQGDLDIDNNLSAINITASGFFFGNGSQLTDIALTEVDPKWSDNFTKYNTTWTSTTNSSYLINNTFAYFSKLGVADSTPATALEVTGNLTLTNANNCIIFASGGKICSGV